MHDIENGVHDLPNEIYHNSNGLSRSALWEFKKSPYHYWHSYINPDRVKKHATPDMLLGEYVHALVLEPEWFEERYAVKPIPLEVPKCGLLKDIGREEYDKQKAAIDAIKAENDLMMAAFIAECRDKAVLSPEVYNQAKYYADAVLRDSVAQALFKDVNIEKSIYFTHEKTGLQCKVRPDAWIGGIVTDLKTCKDASFDAFQRAAYSAGYFIQAAMIKQALLSIDIELEKFFFYCVEKSPSVPCVYYEVDEQSLVRGELEFDTLMYGIADCFETGVWESYSSQKLTYPNWAKY
jgi:hypothetical protein